MVAHLLPWLSLLSIPALLTFNAFVGRDRMFGSEYIQTVLDSFELEYDMHGGSRMKCLLHIVVPWTALLVLIMRARDEYAMNIHVKVEGVLKRCLYLHAFAAFFYSLLIELVPQLLTAICGIQQLPSTDVVFVMKTAFADLFFVLGVCTLLMAMQDTVPRWATFVPLVQAVYNVMNDVRWMNPNAVSSGHKVNHRLNTLDGGIFVSLMISYTYAYFNAVVVDDARKNK
eukprot:11379413-Ditylum_brightwellii.AAC.1